MTFFMAVVCSTIAIIVGCVLTWIKEKQAQEQAIRNAQSKATNEFPIDFYKKCVAHHIKNLDSASDRQRAILIGNQMNIIAVNESNVTSLFAQGKEKIEAEKKRKEEEEISKKRADVANSERRKFQEFSSLYGREKRIKLLRDMLRPLYEDLKTISSTSSSVMRSAYQEKEHNWAILGGMASAIGGTAAGVSVAAQAQMENEKIRQKNKDNRLAMANLSLSFSKLESQCKEKIQDLESKIQAEQIALIDTEKSKEECFEFLNIDYESSVDKIKVLTVSAKINLKEKIFIFDNVSAIIDGSLIAKVSIDGREIGKTLLVLPFCGVSTRISTVTGKIVLPYELNEKTKYTINIYPSSLWAREG